MHLLFITSLLGDNEISPWRLAIKEISVRMCRHKAVVGIDFPDKGAHGFTPLCIAKLIVLIPQIPPDIVKRREP